MKRVLAILMSVMFCFVSIGGNIYVHICKDSFILSFYEKLSPESCIFCAETRKHHEDHDGHCHGECKNEVVKVDQLSHKDYNSSSFLIKLTPAILSLPWIALDFKVTDTFHKAVFTNYLYASIDSSPPIYIKNCIYRI